MKEQIPDGVRVHSPIGRLFWSTPPSGPLVWPETADARSAPYGPHQSAAPASGWPIGSRSHITPPQRWATKGRPAARHVRRSPIPRQCGRNDRSTTLLPSSTSRSTNSTLPAAPPKPPTIVWRHAAALSALPHELSLASRIVFPQVGATEPRASVAARDWPGTGTQTPRINTPTQVAAMFPGSASLPPTLVGRRTPAHSGNPCPAHHARRHSWEA